MAIDDPYRLWWLRIWERARYEDSTFPTSEPSELLWHYTDLEGTLGILQGRCLWASAVRSLDDTQELDYGIEVLREAWAGVRSTAAPRAQVLIDRLFHSIYGADDPRLTAGDAIHVLSFSREPDALPLWQHARGKACALGFNSADLEGLVVEDEAPKHRHGEPHPRYFNGPVLYQRSAQVTLATTLLRFLADIAAERTGRVMPVGALGSTEQEIRDLVWLDIYSMYFRIYCAMVKSQAFSYEAEHRVFVDEVSPQETRYRMRRGLIHPYVTLVSEGRGVLPVAAIRTGPTCDSNDQYALKQLLASLRMERTSIMRSVSKLRA